MMDDTIVDKVTSLVDNILQEKEIELVEITYRREQGGMTLRLLVDKENGITVDECARLNEEIGMLLEAKDLMIDKYLLEIASPGLDRLLKTRRDCERVIGKIINVHTYEPVKSGKGRDYAGVVKSVDDKKLNMDDIEIPLDKISKARLKIEI